MLDVLFAACILVGSFYISDWTSTFYIYLIKYVKDFFNRDHRKENTQNFRFSLYPWDRTEPLLSQRLSNATFTGGKIGRTQNAGRLPPISCVQSVLSIIKGVGPQAFWDAYLLLWLEINTSSFYNTVLLSIRSGFIFKHKGDKWLNVRPGSV